MKALSIFGRIAGSAKALPSVRSLKLPAAAVRTFTLLLVCSAALALYCSPRPDSEPHSPGPAVSTAGLSSGMDVVLLRNRGAPMICSSVVVKAGVMYETPEMNGVSHMLEHLLFNGTTSRTQEELYDEVDFYGGYNNATTRTDHTLFQMLMPSEHIEHGLDIQADMLFNSTLPPEKLEKERGIVIEEIGKDEDDPGYAAGNFFDRVFYGDSPRGMPALGTRETVSEMSRGAIDAYYRRHYRPDNMVALVMGDFDGAEMMGLLERYFGAEAAGVAPAQTDRGGGEPDETTSSPGRFGSPDEPGLSPSERPWDPYEIYTIPLDAERNYFYIAWPLPGRRGYDDLGEARTGGAVGDEPPAAAEDAGGAPVTDAEATESGRRPAPDDEETHHTADDRVAAFTLLEWLLNSGPSSDLDKVLKAEGRSIAHHVGASYTPYSRDGLFQIWAQSDPDVATADFVASAIEAIARIAGPGPDAEELRGAHVSTITEEIYNSERIHHYSMLKAPALAAMSPEELVDELKRGSPASRARIMEAARSLLLEVPFVVCAAGPGLKEGVRRYPYSPPTLEGPGDSAPAEPPTLDPASAGIPLASSRRTVREEIPGGPVAIVRHNPDSRVFAVHVLVRHRSRMEPPGKAGIADMLHRLLPAGTTDKNREELERELNAIGARLKVTDNPYIPFDDYYFVPEYSYLRLETIDLFYREGLGLLAEMMNSPRLEEDDIERVRAEMLAAVGKASESTSSKAKRIYHENLFAGTALASPPEGYQRTISSITREDLDAFHAEYMDPSNLIVSIVSNVDASAVVEDLRGILSGSSASQPSYEYKMPPTEPRVVTDSMEKGQSYIYVGFTFEPDHEDEAALAVMARILSDRMAFEIRERQGLAYRVGASLHLRPQGAWLSASMGTRPANVEVAKTAMLEAFHDMAEAEISEDDVERTRNSMLGRHLMRTIFSMGRAYHEGLGEFFGENRQGDGLLRRAEGVTPADVKRVALKYLSHDDFLVVVVE
jgi:predicted Zn-dependent peptidase